MPFVGHAVGYEQQHRKLDPNRYLTRAWGDKWRLRIWHNGRLYQLGYYTLLEGRLARDRWLVRHSRQVRFCRRVPR